MKWTRLFSLCYNNDNCLKKENVHYGKEINADRRPQHLKPGLLCAAGYD